jgi:hypothetical protein
MPHPPSTNSSPSTARRALKTGVAALGAIAAPIVLVATTAGGSGVLGTQQSVPAQRVIHTQDATTPVRFLDTAGAFGKGLATHLANGELTGIQGLASDATTTTFPSAPAAPALPAAAPAPPAPPAPTPPTRVARAAVATPVAAPAPAPTPSASGLAYGDPADPATWDRLAQCEAGGNWARNSGNGYYGGLQFSASSWRGVGGTGLPSQNSRETQIEMGRRLQARSGWGQWPACTRRLHYR